jgi:hypothetical protein
VNQSNFNQTEIRFDEALLCRLTGTEEFYYAAQLRQPTNADGHIYIYIYIHIYIYIYNTQIYVRTRAHRIYAYSLILCRDAIRNRLNNCFTRLN